MGTPVEEFRNVLIETCEYYMEKSSKGCVAAPTVIHGVVRGLMDKYNKCFPPVKKPIVLQPVVKRIVLVKKASKK